MSTRTTPYFQKLSWFQGVGTRAYPCLTTDYATRGLYATVHTREALRDTRVSASGIPSNRGMLFQPLLRNTYVKVSMCRSSFVDVFLRRPLRIGYSPWVFLEILPPTRWSCKVPEKSYMTFYLVNFILKYCKSFLRPFRRPSDPTGPTSDGNRMGSRPDIDEEGFAKETLLRRTPLRGTPLGSPPPTPFTWCRHETWCVTRKW